MRLDLFLLGALILLRIGDHPLVTQFLSPPAATVKSEMTAPPSHSPVRGLSPITNVLIAAGYLQVEDDLGTLKIRALPFLLKKTSPQLTPEIISELKRRPGTGTITYLMLEPWGRVIEITFVAEGEGVGLGRVKDLITGAVEEFQNGVPTRVSYTSAFPVDRQFPSLLAVWVARTVGEKTYKKQLQQAGIPIPENFSSAKGREDILSSLVTQLVERFPEFKRLIAFPDDNPEGQEQLLDLLEKDDLLPQSIRASREELIHFIQQQAPDYPLNSRRVVFLSTDHRVTPRGEPVLSDSRIGVPVQGPGKCVARIALDLTHGDLYTQWAGLIYELLQIQVTDDLQELYPHLDPEQMHQLIQDKVIETLAMGRAFSYFVRLPNVTVSDLELDQRHYRILMAAVQANRTGIRRIFEDRLPKELVTILETPPLSMPSRGLSPMTNLLVSEKFLERSGQNGVKIAPKLLAFLLFNMVRQKHKLPTQLSLPTEYSLEIEIKNMNGKKIVLAFSLSNGKVQLTRIADKNTGAFESFNEKGESIEVNYGRYLPTQQLATLLHFWSARTVNMKIYQDQLRQLLSLDSVDPSSEDGAWQVLEKLVMEVFRRFSELQGLTTTDSEKVESNLKQLADDHELVISPKELTQWMQKQPHRREGERLRVGFFPLYWEIDSTGTGHLATISLNVFDENQYSAWIGIDIDQGDVYAQLAAILHHLIYLQVIQDLRVEYPSILQQENFEKLKEWQVLDAIVMRRQVQYFLRLHGINRRDFEIDELACQRIISGIIASHLKNLIRLFEGKLPEELGDILETPFSDAIEVDDILNDQRKRTLQPKVTKLLKAHHIVLVQLQLNKLIEIITAKGFTPGSISIKGLGRVNQLLNRLFVLTSSNPWREEMALELAL